MLTNISIINNDGQDSSETTIKNDAKLMKGKENVTPNITFNAIDPYPSTSKVSRDPVKNSKLNTYNRNAARKALQIPVTRKIACHKCKNATSLYLLVKCTRCVQKVTRIFKFRGFLESVCIFFFYYVGTHAAPEVR